MTQPAVGPLLMLVLVLACDAWVTWDAAQRRARGHNVIATVGPVTLDRPERWLIACILVWLIALPLYLIARRE